MLLVVDRIGQLLFGLLDLVALAVLLKEVEDRLLVDLHSVPFSLVR